MVIACHYNVLCDRFDYSAVKIWDFVNLNEILTPAIKTCYRTTWGRVKTQVCHKSCSGYVFSMLYKLFFSKGLLTNLKSFKSLMCSSNNWVICGFYVFHQKLQTKTNCCEVFSGILYKNVSCSCILYSF